MWVIRRTLTRHHKYVDRWMLIPTYPHNFVRQRLCSPLPLSEIRPRSVQFRSIQFFVKSGLDAKQLFIGRELIPPRVSRGASAECDIVSVMSMSGPSGASCRKGQVGVPGLKLAFAARSLLADISVGLKCYRKEVLSVIKGA